MTKTKICGPQRIGASTMDEGDLTRAVVGSYSTLTQDEAREAGQRAAEQVLPARRRLWALAERLIPGRLAAALRARCGTDDPTARDGVRALRLALADWLDPPPVCRWCRAPIRPGDEGRVCSAARGRRQRAAALSAGGQVALLADSAETAHGASHAATRAARKWTPRPVVCRPAKAHALGPVARCGTLALYTAGQVSLEVMAAALAVPKGAAKGYDVACDRDAKALTVATADAPPPGRDLACAEDWQDEALRRMYAAVAGLGATTCLPPPVQAAREEWRRIRGLAVAANGRAVLGIQTRYYAPRDGVCRADLVQGAAIGADRGLQDYDATQSRYTTYGADWMRQGCGEAWGDRDLVGTPEWVHALRSKVEDRLPGITRADVLRAIEALADAVAPDAPPAVRAAARTRAEELARLVVTTAEVRENVLGSRPARYVRRPLFADQSEDAIDAHAFAALKAALGKRKKAAASVDAEDPERARERVADWLADRLRLPKASGSGMLAALRHGAPVFVQVGSGGDDDDAETQGAAGDGGGGTERLAAVLAAPDEADALAEEEVGRARWQAALAALAALRDSGGREAAEVVRRHHGLDSLAEDRGGQTGESFASIAATGLTSTGRRLTKEGVRKIYQRGLAVMTDYIAGRVHAGDLPALFATAEEVAEDCGPVRVPRSPWRPVRPATASPVVVPDQPRPVIDGAAWEAFRDEAGAVAW